MRRTLVLLFLLIFSANLLIAETVDAAAILYTSEEVSARGYWQEFDITFWQTLPFAALWVYFFNSQLFPATASNWAPVFNLALVVSVGNAWIHANKVTRK